MSDFLEIFFMCFAMLAAIVGCCLPTMFMSWVASRVEVKLGLRGVSYDTRSMVRMLIEFIGVSTSLSLLFAVGATAYRYAQ